MNSQLNEARLTGIKTALVHHWFLVYSGGERVCDALARILPHPDFFTLLCRPEVLPPSLLHGQVRTSFLQRLPAAMKYYRYYAFFYPLAVEQWDLGAYDLVVSSDPSAVKGVLTRPETCHVCYCHSPMRYIWNMYNDYLPPKGRVKRAVFALLAHYLRMWDFAASARVDYFIANSNHVRRRIWKYYRREAQVIYPPCDVERFRVSDRVDDYYLLVTRLVGYKRTDLAVEAFTRSKKRLVIIGEGPDESRLKTMAGPNIEFIGWQNDRDLAEYYSHCRALIFPGEEDFGIVPVEAQASGRPVVAFGRGGALETIRDGVSGFFFQRQTPEDLNDAIDHLEQNQDSLDPETIRRHALRFGGERFREEAAAYLIKCLAEHQERMGGFSADRET